MPPQFTPIFLFQQQWKYGQFYWDKQDMYQNVYFEVFSACMETCFQNKKTLHLKMYTIYTVFFLFTAYKKWLASCIES